MVLNRCDQRCKYGFQGYACEDINECLDPTVCPDPVKSLCKNKNPGFACVDPVADDMNTCQKVSKK